MNRQEMVEKLSSEILESCGFEKEASVDDREDTVVKIASEIIESCGFEKEAKERASRINAFKEYYEKDPYQSRAINRELDSAEGRLQRAKLKSELAGASGAKRVELKGQLGELKHQRNKRIMQGIGDGFNIPMQFRSAGNRIGATAKGSAHNMFLGATPGSVLDEQAAKTLAMKDMAKKRR